MQHSARKVAGKDRPHANHHVLETGPECKTEPPRLNYQEAEWDAVREELSARLNELDAGGSISTEVEFYSRLNKLMLAITGAIDTKVPKVRPSPYQKWWWSKSCLQSGQRYAGWHGHTGGGHHFEDPIHHKHKAAWVT